MLKCFEKEFSTNTKLVQWNRREKREGRKERKEKRKEEKEKGGTTSVAELLVTEWENPSNKE